MRERVIRSLIPAAMVAAAIGANAAPLAPIPVNAIARAIQASSGTQSQAKDQLVKNLTEYSEARAKAADVASRIKELAETDPKDLPSDSAKRLEALVQDISQVNDRLQRLEGQIKDVLDWIADQSNENLPIMQNDIATLKKPGIGNYVQFQWANTDEHPGQTTTDGLQMRRFRIGQRNKIDENTTLRLSFDVATGSNRISAELRDAHLIYDFIKAEDRVGGQLIAGQQPLPLGYELERSSAEREFPERARYNTTLFAGERDRGVLLKYGISKNEHVSVGVWQGMTFLDPQQSADGFRDADQKLGYTVGIRSEGANYSAGFATLQSERPSFTDNANDVIPVVKRSIYFVDANYVVNPQISLRGELMWGHDRVPTGGKTNPRFEEGTDVLGWQAQVTYNATSRNQFHLRYQYFDPDTNSSTSPGTHVRGWGFGYTYWMNPGAKLTLTYETFDEQGAEIRNNVWTLRYQFRL